MRAIDDESGWLRRINNLFVDRELYMRTNGHVRFLLISARVQRFVAVTVVAALLVWGLATVVMLVDKADVLRDRANIAKKEAEVHTAEQKVAAYRQSVDEKAVDLEERQEFLESVVKSHFGDKPLPGSEDKAEAETQEAVAEKSADDAAPEGEAEKTAATTGASAAIPAAAKLQLLEERQLAFADHLTKAVAERTLRAERAIMKLGLVPDQVAHLSSRGLGGPFIPFFGTRKVKLDPKFTRLDRALRRMDALESALVALPSAKPAAAGMMTSRFGYRRDPFTGAAAMHSGIDFKGAYGSPIRSAAAGKVVFAGRRSGYGNTVEVSHGNGIMTRYAHMSRIEVKPGQRLARGNTVGRMGSTGRSTGTHLHFEVRLRGKAINPRPFLEANSDVLEVQAVARQRSNARTKS